jgi:glutathione S-transferase
MARDALGNAVDRRQPRAHGRNACATTAPFRGRRARQLASPADTIAPLAREAVSLMTARPASTPGVGHGFEDGGEKMPFPPPRNACGAGRAPALRRLDAGARGARRTGERTMRLYDFLSSGNGYKVRLLLHLLGIPFERVELDIVAGATRTPEFLEKNPNGRIPLLELPDGRRLAESNAILFYLAEGTEYLPAERWSRAQVLQWMFFEQYSHEPNIATSRFWLHYLELTPERRAALAQKHELGKAALAVMERHLAARAFFVDERYSIADIALYAYTHVADEGGFDLEPYPAVRRWLARVAAHPRHVPITHPFEPFRT